MPPCAPTITDFKFVYDLFLGVLGVLIGTPSEQCVLNLVHKTETRTLRTIHFVIKQN